MKSNNYAPPFYWINNTGEKVPLTQEQVERRAYFLGGYQVPEDKGKLSIMVQDNGTALVPVFRVDGSRPCEPKHAGKDYKELI